MTLFKQYWTLFSGNQYESVIISRGMRSGTVPHVLAVGLGAACEVALEELEVI